jgi:hypothetical protein
MRRWALIGALLLLSATPGPALAAATPTPAMDTAVATGSSLSFRDIDINAQSGPAGETRAGTCHSGCSARNWPPAR